ncbi:MAG TPA: ABC transporter ATP-binding protein [Mesotoga infera]|jgi:ABC-2 type transport system ATP-binding protein|nr:ABC transporter ATP-binding protein [Mesotoga sp.]HON28223.1 ABC transporter ATP-binding protein [Mesotoga infera]HPD37805.1 ABC transporter ATP-binding protein [Mesotoga infera]HRR44084.1 ABC transporter ATP-binding protein [Mesotoga sp.]HRV01194.1 ABC transporter ATP-binding protein [Mesotoga sp.]
MEIPELTLKISNLKKTYPGEVQAVRGVSLEMESQRIYALLGPNGAGKTTVLKSILGFVDYSGSVEVFGSDVDRVRNRLSFVPEEKSFYENLNVEKALRLASKISGSFDGKHARELINHYKLPPNKKIGTFSNGMKTALYISLALSTDSDLYILDEPTWGLDPILREDTLEFIREKVIVGKTVLYTSHIIPEVERIADEFFIMVNGRVRFAGTIDGIKEKYRIIHMPLKKRANIESKSAFAVAEELNRLSVIVENNEKIEEFYRIDDATISVPDLEEFFQILVRSENGK